MLVSSTKHLPDRELSREQTIFIPCPRFLWPTSVHQELQINSFQHLLASQRKHLCLSSFLAEDFLQHGSLVCHTQSQHGGMGEFMPPEKNSTNEGWDLGINAPAPPLPSPSSWDVYPTWFIRGSLARLSSGCPQCY